MLKDYLEGVFGCCTFLIIMSGITHHKFKNATGFGVGVLIICVIMLPLVDIFKGFDIDKEIEDLIGDVDYEASDDMIKNAFEKGISEYIASEYSVNEQFVTVMANGFDLEVMRAERIYVTLSGKAIYLNYSALESDIENRFTKEGKCEVKVRLD